MTPWWRWPPAIPSSTCADRRRPMAFSLDRRRMLQGMVAGVPIAIALPRLDAMLDGNGLAYAGGRPLPRRFGVWAFANGVHLDRWVPKKTGRGNEWELRARP